MVMETQWKCITNENLIEIEMIFESKAGRLL